MNLRSILILAGLVLGLGVGALLGDSATGITVVAVARPIGTLWLNALTMTVVPLVFSLLVTGIVAAGREAGGSRIGIRALVWFAILLVAACLLSVVVTTVLLDVWPVPASAAALRTGADAAPAIGSTSDWLTGFIPTNPIKAASDTAMTPLVVFALLFGFAISRIEPELQRQLDLVFKAIVQAMLVIVQWILWLAPIGVCALAIGVGAKMGTGAAGALGHYVIVIAIACIATALACYVAGPLLGRVSPLAFARAVLPAQVVALSTQSSLASLPAMIDAANALGVRKAEAGVVLPLAVSIFRAASAAANVSVAIYLAHLLGIPLGAGLLLLGACVAAVVSLAAVGLPAQVSFFATIGPVCLAMGVPIGILPLLLAVETFPDIFRTVGNVTADLAVARIVGSR
ncbi:cation:dicarboxylase symporter family transporter [Sphingomonas sp. H39-1-10]|uniref:dicarboxylate/amino acid:cation symporter n=1 Tax=Sphingomonas pollutisoli TaxID=3030829 RepID=UPI0023B8DB42|nr:cation:dicarboxylase symporter family transporter [Sphingomonas pollutisoli]MDF0486683.1 cation:dicarboxylase symporter family transporter [Sphingomonas pollutisoli]